MDPLISFNAEDERHGTQRMHGISLASPSAIHERIRLPHYNNNSTDHHGGQSTISTQRSKWKHRPLSALKRVGSIFQVALLACLGLVGIMYLQVERLQRSSIFHHQVPTKVTSDISEPATVIFPHFRIFESNDLPLSLPLPPLQDDGEKDFGNLEIHFFQDDNTEVNRRQIYKDYMLKRRQYRSPYENRDDDMAPYYAFDDDVIKGAQMEGDSSPCRRISDHRLNFQNCNTFHEQHLLEESMAFLGEGAFREVFGLEHVYCNEVEKVVLKELRFDEKIDQVNYEFIRMDASVAERLSASPRTFDIYGFCGVGILSEFFFHGDISEVAFDDEEGEASEDLRSMEEFIVQNDLSGREKLVLALEMAEGVAVLHGFSGGVIVHDDIQLSQFLLNKEKTMVKINDFNRAEYMLYDDSKQVYCKYYNGEGPGNWRSPEEYKDEALNEKIDVWSLGNNMYSILTGFAPFPWLNSDEMKPLVTSGVTAYVDPRFWTRSKEEAKLAGIIKNCFAYDPNTRPSVFDIVTELRLAVAESLGTNITRAEVLLGLGE